MSLHRYWQILFPNFACCLLQTGSTSKKMHLFHYLCMRLGVNLCCFLPMRQQSCSAVQEQGAHGAGCSSTTPPMKTSEAGARVCFTETLRRRARRAAGCRRTTRGRLTSTTNPGSGKRSTSPKRLQVTVRILKI